jgi:hypothetical protein
MFPDEPFDAGERRARETDAVREFDLGIEPELGFALRRLDVDMNAWLLTGEKEEPERTDL